MLTYKTTMWTLCMQPIVWYKTIFFVRTQQPNMWQKPPPSVQDLRMCWDSEQAFNMQLSHREPYKHEGTDDMSEINSKCRASGTLKHVQFSQRKRSFSAIGNTATSEIYPQTWTSLMSHLLSTAHFCRIDLSDGVCCGWPTSCRVTITCRRSNEITAAHWDTDVHFHR